MSISSHYHKYLAKTLGETDEFVLIGENATKAGRLGGLSDFRGSDYEPIIEKIQPRYFDIPNCELGHVGMTFGLALSGFKVFLFVKQLDFLALANDHFLNTFTQLELYGDKVPGSVYIITFSVDIDFQGPQSSFCSPFDAIPGNIKHVYTPNFKEEIESIFSVRQSKPENPLLSIICLSQKNFRKPERFTIKEHYESFSVIRLSEKMPRVTKIGIFLHASVIDYVDSFSEFDVVISLTAPRLIIGDEFRDFSGELGSNIKIFDLWGSENECRRVAGIIASMNTPNTRIEICCKNVGFKRMASRENV
jgi:hypothetical protein